MGFEDIGKRMATRKPRSPAVLLAFAGVLLIGLNYVINEASWEHAEFGGRHFTTHVPAIVGVVCLIGALVARRYPWVAVRLAFALGGIALFGLDIVMVEWSRMSAETAGESSYWVWHLPGGVGCLLLIGSVIGIGDDWRNRHMR
jgi:hypothetical protein